MASIVDAKASHQSTSIGGWLPERNSAGTVGPWSSVWYGEIRKDELPKVFEKDDLVAFLISTLEAPTVLVVLRVFYGGLHPRRRHSVQVLSTWTNKRSNGTALEKLMTTRYLASAVILELACFTMPKSIKASNDWMPWTVNGEADVLAHHGAE